MAGVVVPIDGDIAPLLAEFAKLPGRTQQEMDAVGKVIEQEITRGRIAKGFADLPGVSQKQAKKAANMLAREIDKGARQAEASLKDVDKALKVLGTSALDDIMDLGEGLAALGPAGVAVGVALTGAAAAAGALMAGGALTTFLYESANATGALKDENKALTLVMDSLQQKIGRQVAPTFEQLLTVAVALGLGLSRVLDDVFEQIGAMTDWYDSLGVVGRGIIDTQTPILKMLSSAKRLNSGTDDLAGSMGGLYDEAKGLIGVLGVGGGGKGDGVAPALHATAKGVAAVSQQVQQALPHLDAMSVILRGEGEDDTSWLDTQIQTSIRDMPKATEEVVKYEGAGLALTDSLGGAAGAIGDLVGGLATEGSKAASAAVGIQKAAAIVAITISTAQAVMQALTLPPPASFVAAAAVGVTGAAQAALVAAQPEAFHTGGLKGWAPDESIARVRSGEGVLTGQGVQAMGGAAGVAAANRGEVGAREIRVVAQYQHRVFDAMIGDNIRMRSSPLHGALRDGKRAGVRRG